MGQREQNIHHVSAYISGIYWFLNYYFNPIHFKIGGNKKNVVEKELQLVSLYFYSFAINMVFYSWNRNGNDAYRSHSGGLPAWTVFFRNTAKLANKFTVHTLDNIKLCSSLHNKIKKAL